MNITKITVETTNPNIHHNKSHTMATVNGSKYIYLRKIKRLYNLFKKISPQIDPKIQKKNYKWNI